MHPSERDRRPPVVTDWHRVFSQILISGDAGEIGAATQAASDAIAHGASPDAAKAAGKAAAKRYRSGRPVQWTDPFTRPPGGQTLDVWNQVAPRLMAPPARWGWRAPEVAATPTESQSQPIPRPVWTEPPPPDTTALHDARSKAVTRLIVRIALTVILAFAFTTYSVAIAGNISAFGTEATEVYQVVILVIGALLVIGIFRAATGVRRASDNITRFEQPYQAFRAAEQERHQQALAQWEQSVRAAEQAASTAPLSTELTNGPMWYPVTPAVDPTRVDVIGGDPHRHGWASLLTTLGTSVLARKEQLTVLDLTGQEVAGGLLAIADATGVSRRDVPIEGDEDDVNVLAGITRCATPVEALTYVLCGSGDHRDLREERAFVSGVLRQIVQRLPGEPTFGRLAGAVRVLRQGDPEGVLTASEISSLSEVVPELARSDWVERRLRYLTSQLDTLGRSAADSDPVFPFETTAQFSVFTTPGGMSDRKQLIDRVLVQLARLAMDGGGLSGVAVVAGADHLGADILRRLSEHARMVDVRLVVLIDHAQGGFERSVGTGGAACFLKAYNHHDANLAAEFIGRGHRFVVNQITQQVGKSFTESGGDNFNASTNQGSSARQKSTGRPGRGTGLSESRGHTWGATRSWSSADNLGTSTSTGRVYEFVVEPQEIMGMPETAFILVDNTGSGRRVAMADANPGICLLNRVSSSPG